jgi:hypothetical protein
MFHDGAATLSCVRPSAKQVPTAIATVVKDILNPLAMSAKSPRASASSPADDASAIAESHPPPPPVSKAIANSSTPHAGAKAKQPLHPKDLHNPAMDLTFSIGVIDPQTFSSEGMAIMEAYYTELLLQHGPSARVYWYRAQLYKLQHRITDYLADLERMHVCDDGFLAAYLTHFDPLYEYCDENTLTFMPWSLWCQVYRTRKLLAAQVKTRNRKIGLAAMKNTSAAAMALARFGQERKVPPDVMAILQLLRQYHSLVLELPDLSPMEQSCALTFRGDTWRQQGDLNKALLDYDAGTLHHCVCVFFLRMFFERLRLGSWPLSVSGLVRSFILPCFFHRPWCSFSQV